MKMNNYKLIRKIALAALGLLLLLCMSFVSIFSTRSSDALSGVPTDTTVGPIYDFSKNCYDLDKLNSLAENILGSGKNFNDLITAATGAGTRGTPVLNNRTITLQYGRYRYTKNGAVKQLAWLPVYISKSNSGAAILTLYLAATQKTSSSASSAEEVNYFSYDSEYTADPNCVAPSNSYATSHMRASTLGNVYTQGVKTNYAYYTDETHKSSAYTMQPADLYEANCNKFSDFIMGNDFTGDLYDDIATPSEIAWQENESYFTSIGEYDGHEYCFPNDAYGVPQQGTYFMPAYFDYVEQKKLNYNDWQYDKVWLPSVTEVGTGDYDAATDVDSTNGLWKLTKNHRSNTVTSWLRTANPTANRTSGYSAYTMFCTDENGNVVDGDVDKIYAVRPAIHLNLSKITTKTKAPVNLPDVVSTPYNGEAQTISKTNGVTIPDPEKNIPWYSANDMVVNFFSDEACKQPATPIDAGTYYMVVTLTNEDAYFYGETKSTRYKIAKFVVQKLQVGVKWTYYTTAEDGVKLNGIPKSVDFDYDNFTFYQRDFESDRIPELGMKYNNINGTYQGLTEFPDVIGTYRASAYIINENLMNYNYELSTSSALSNQFYVAEKELLQPKFLGVDESNMSLDYRGRQYVQIENINLKYINIAISAPNDSNGRVLAKLAEMNGLEVDEEAKEIIVDSESGINVYKGIATFAIEDVSRYVFEFSLVDTKNTIWATSTDANKDINNKSLNLDINRSRITVNFKGLLSSWGTMTEMKFTLETTGLYENTELPISVSYQNSSGNSRLLVPDSATGVYSIPTGLAEGTYTISAQLNDSTGNYYMDGSTNQKFTITRAEGTWRDSEEYWEYVLNGKHVDVGVSAAHNTEETALEVPYVGNYYQFALTISETRLKSDYFVRAIYEGDIYVKDAGLYSVTVTIAAYDKNVHFDPVSYTIYFRITQTTFDLSGLQWDYTSAYTYNTKEQSVFLKPETIPTGLTVTYTGNTGTDAGSYSARVNFMVSDDYVLNYKTPTSLDSNTYTGSFNFTLDWEINKLDIIIKWTEAVSSSDLAFIPTLQVGHNYVNYSYEKNSGGSWVATNDVSAQTVTETFRVTAALKPEFEANYTLSDPNGVNPCEFEVQSGKQAVTFHIEVNNSKCEDGEEFTYTGNTFTAKLVVDSGSLSTNDFTIKYYRVISGSRMELDSGVYPEDAGEYVAVANVSSSSSYSSADSVSEITFRIVKADVDTSNLYWIYEHRGLETKVYYDATQLKWVTENGLEFKFSFVYDGMPHSFMLSGRATGLDIGSTTGNTGTDAGSYTANVSLTSTSNYNAPSFPQQIEWEITPAELDFTYVEWGYIDNDGNEYRWDFDSDPFPYTRDEEGHEVPFTVGLINLPEAVQGMISYRTTSQTTSNSTAVAGNTFSGIDVYLTTVTFSGTVNDPNYKPFNMEQVPASIPRFQYWEIARRELHKPEYDGSWEGYDGKVHDLIELSGVPKEELPYFTVDITYIDANFVITNDFYGYDGVRYAACDAGQYIVRFYEMMMLPDPNNPAALVDTPIFFGQAIIEPGREKVVVKWDWDGSAPAARVSGIYSSGNMIGTKYTNESGGEVPLSYILVTQGIKFFAEPYVTEEFSKNLEIEMAEENGIKLERKVSFYSSQFVKDDDTRMLEKPEMENASSDGVARVEYTGNEITFNIEHWGALYSPYLYISEGSLTQTEVGEYYVTLSFKGDANAMWAGDENRADFILRFEITAPKTHALEAPKLSFVSAQFTGYNITFELVNWVILQDYINMSGASLVQREIGIYTVTFTIKEGSDAYWADASEEDKYGTYSVQFEIYEKTPTLDTDKMLPDPVLEVDYYYYTGNDIIFKILNISALSSYVDIIDGSLTQVEVGDYTVTLKIRDGVDKIFSNGSKTYTLSFSIEQDPDAHQDLDKPVFEDPEIEYTGSDITFVIVNWEKRYSNFLEIVEGAGYLTQKEVGNYTVTFRFKDGVDACWKDGTTDDYRLGFSIVNNGETPVDPPSGELPVDPVTGKVIVTIPTKMVKPSQEYTGGKLAFEIEGWDKIKAYVKIADANNDAEGALIKTAVGEYVVFLQLIDKDIAMWEGGSYDSVPVRFSITPSSIDFKDMGIGSDGKLHTVKDGEVNLDDEFNFDDYFEVTYYDADGNKVSADQLEKGKDYTASYTLKEDKAEEFKKNFANADAIIASLTANKIPFTFEPNSEPNIALIISIAVVSLLVFLIIATIIILAVKRANYNSEPEYADDYNDYDDYDDYDE